MDVLQLAEIRKLESDGIASVAAQQLVSRAVQVFGDLAIAKEWLEEPIPSLAGNRPIDLIHGSESDQLRVYTILGRVEHGIF